MTLDPKIKAAADSVRGHAGTLRAIIAMAEAVEEIARLEQAADLAEGRKRDADEYLKGLNAEIAIAEGRKATAEREMLGAEGKVEAIVRNARKEAQELIEQAREDAKAEAERVKAAGMQSLASLNRKIEDAKQRLAGVEGEIVAAINERNRAATALPDGWGGNG